MKGNGCRIVEFPGSRLATVDIGALSRRRHTVTALLELDVTGARARLREARRANRERVSFTGWLVRTIAATVRQHPQVAAFRHGRRKLVVFDEVAVSVVVEKELDGDRVPIPLVIRQAADKTGAAITAEIEDAKAERLGRGQAVLGQRGNPLARLYYFLPGALRRLVWRVMLSHPRFVFRQMGNVAVTSLGTIGRIDGWFIHTSVHPLSIGIGSVIPRPVAAGAEVRTGEILRLTVLVDHDVVDGAPMARFIQALSANVEGGLGL
ncbi:MAG TPA: 2-oxo acid dehydrogenase subunit E2 [Candidatus Aminicenantes bacterium]|nr:2-oxo acid dehydrogenase subunit E2 [Candidatus Aminicenantes bacterium]